MIYALNCRTWAKMLVEAELVVQSLEEVDVRILVDLID
jgi:hypothetical protein